MSRIKLSPFSLEENDQFEQKVPSDFTPTKYYSAKNIQSGNPDSLECSTFKKVPTDVTIHLLSFLPSKDLICISAVNRTFKSLADSDKIWKMKCVLKYGPNLFKLHNHSYRSLYYQIPENIRCIEAEKQYHIHQNERMRIACGMRAPPKIAPRRDLKVNSFAPVGGFKEHPNSTSNCIIKFTTPDLCTVAEALYKFHSYEAQHGKYYIASLSRYHNFMKLKAKYPDLFLVPTYDIEQCWISHLIRPSKYRNDCLKLYGSIIPHQFLLSEEQKQFFKEALEQTRELYKQEYGQEYCEMANDIEDKWQFSKGPFSPMTDLRPVANYTTDAIAILPNANTFYNPFSFTPGDINKDDNWITFFNKYVGDNVKRYRSLSKKFYARVVKSYERFLYMAAKYPPSSGEFVHPTYAIDLFWHSHMIYPLEYYNDSIRVVGYFMDHEPWPDVEFCTMKASFADTAKQWESEFGLNIDKEHLYDNPDTPFFAD